MIKSAYNKRILRRKLDQLQKRALLQGLNVLCLQLHYIPNFNYTHIKRSNKKFVLVIATIFILCLIISLNVLNHVLSTRCLLESNYLVWETTRPISDCRYCMNITKPIILWNVTRRSFADYAYSSQPIIVKNGIRTWKAAKKFNFELFKKLYEQTSGSYESLDDGCQFLSFKSDLFSLKEVFSMPEARARNAPGQKPWYVGWGNCHPDILAKARQYYSIPDFFPLDAEFPATENIFFGYEIGAVMHLDYIPRLMWQGQVKGNKIWTIAPVPECDAVCNKFKYYVETGDLVLLDTRIWYHETRIPKGVFSLTVQSEYG